MFVTHAHGAASVHYPDIKGACDASGGAGGRGHRLLGERRVLSKGYRQLLERRMRNKEG